MAPIGFLFCGGRSTHKFKNPNVEQQEKMGEERSLLDIICGDLGDSTSRKRRRSVDESVALEETSKKVEELAPVAPSSTHDGSVDDTNSVLPQQEEEAGEYFFAEIKRRRRSISFVGEDCVVHVHNKRETKKKSKK